MNIYELIKTEENAYKTNPVSVVDGFEFHMPEHIRQCVLYKNGRRTQGNENDDQVPLKNIILPILNVAYRTEGFDVKDIEPYVNSDKDYHKSFLVRKFHDKWAVENGMDTFIDEIVESYTDYGAAFVKNVKEVRPEVIPLQKIAFCDQTDILSGPFAIKHQYSIDQLLEKKGAWDSAAIDDIIASARSEKQNNSSNQKSQTPGKYIEVFEVHGMFPKAWLTNETQDYNEYDEDEYSRQIHICSYATKEGNVVQGTTLFKGPEKDGLFKLLKRDKIFGRALGRSAIEELFESQVWTTYNLIQVKKMLDKSAMMLAITDSPEMTGQRLTDLDHGEILKKAPNSTFEPFIFPAINVSQFENAIIAWENHGRTTGSANEAQLGISPSSGTPFKLQELVTQEGKGIHEYRRGQIAAFMEEIYRDWILPRLVAEMNKGQEFMSELTLEELQDVGEKVIGNQINTEIKKKILAGKMVTQEEAAVMKEAMKGGFMKQGTKRFMKVLKGELADIPMDVRINVAGKQKNLVAYVDKLSNIVRQVLANPAMLQDPNASKLLNSIFEASGLSPINFTMGAPPPQPAQPVPSPITPQLTPQTNG